MRNELPAIFVIGHSTWTIESFMDLLDAHSINFLVDIRTIPKSRHNPQFNEGSLKKKLDDHNIKYLHMKGLGGLRHSDKNSVNLGWHNLSFRGFADYMQTEEFNLSIKKLIKLSKTYNVAIMCAEGNPFRCHRSLVADALLVRQTKAYHISSKISTREHILTPFAKVKGHNITYP